MNSGLMITQYTQAGILNDRKRLAHPSVTDNIPTCANQEDYVAMGYNASKKALDSSEKLNQILAIELLAAYQSYQYLPKDLKRSKVTQGIFKEISKSVPVITEDELLYPYIENLIKLNKDGTLIKIAEKHIGSWK